MVGAVAEGVTAAEWVAVDVIESLDERARERAGDACKVSMGAGGGRGSLVTRSSVRKSIIGWCLGIPSAHE